MNSMDEEELLENFEEDHEVEDSKFRKVFIFIIGIVMVLLMVSYIFVSFPISDIIRGQVESEPVKNNVIDLGNISIEFIDDALLELQRIYNAQQRVEFSLCLLGEKEGSKYYIKGLYQPRMFKQTFNQVTFAPCSSETLIMLHSHPYKSCLASPTDLETLKKNKRINKDILMVVMCEPARFSVYGQ